MEKDKIHKTDFLLSWCRGVATLESIRSCGDSLSTYLKVSWAVNLQQPEIKSHISVPEAQRLRVGKKLLGVDYIYLDSTSCPHCPEALECALILRTFEGTGWYQQCRVWLPSLSDEGFGARAWVVPCAWGAPHKLVLQGARRKTQGCSGKLLSLLL